MKSLGLRVQLGHGGIAACDNPIAAFNNDFVVIDDHGIHEISLDYCNCTTAQPKDVQLLRASWYPATVVNPKTAATFRVLERFHILNYESKASVFEFYYSLSRETNNIGGTVPVSSTFHAAIAYSLTWVQDRYDSFLIMIREWRHLMSLKRSGRGHDPGGIAATLPGETAVICPACPQPKSNLPEGWEDAPIGIWCVQRSYKSTMNVNDVTRWLYCLFLAIDANFRLQNKLISSDAVDPALNNGSMFFVRDALYKAHLVGYGPQDTDVCMMLY